jgi:hypothetical protein
MDVAEGSTPAGIEWDRVRAAALSTVRQVFTINLFLGGAYLIDTRSNTYLGLFLVGWSILRVSVNALTAYGRAVSPTLIETIASTRANTRIDLWLVIDAITRHRAVFEAFERLKKGRRIPLSVPFEEWRKGLVERYRTRYGTAADDACVKRITFEFRAGQLWKDGEYSAVPFLHHEILIPDSAMKREHAELYCDTENLQYDGLRIRVCVINGVLKVQVGKWNEEFGHREPGQQYDWMAWDTVTSFPLLLNPLDHYLSPRLLLFDYFTVPHHRKGWAKEKKRFFRLTEEYRRVLGTWGEYGEHALADRQAKAFQRWLNREGFKRTWGDEPPRRPCWRNDVMQIDISAIQVDHDEYKWFSDEGQKQY